MRASVYVALLGSMFVVSLVMASLMMPVRIAHALGLDVVSVGFGSAKRCDYVSASEVWCASSTGIKILNPTTRSTSSTLFSGIDMQDIECGNGNCYSWHFVGDPSTANLTRWSVSTKQILNTTQLAAAASHSLGYDFALVPGNEASGVNGNTLIVPSVEGSCGGASSTLHGHCVLGYDLSVGRFVSSGDTGAGFIIHFIEWGGEYASVGDPDNNRVLIGYQESGAGNDHWRIIDLGDADSNWSSVSICASGILSGISFDMPEVEAIDGSWYIPVSTSPGLVAVLDQSGSSCASSTFADTTYDIPSGIAYDSGEELYFVGSHNDDGGTVESSIQVFNSTGDEIAEFDTTSGTTTNFLYAGWFHSTESEYMILRGLAQMLVLETVPGVSDGDDSVGVDIDGDGDIDFFIEDTNGDGVPDFEWSDAPLLVGNASETVPNVLTVLAGVDVDAANVIVGILVPIALVSALGLGAAKYDGDLPMFVYGLVFVAGIGISVAMGWLEAWWVVIGILGFIVSAAKNIKGVFT